MDLLSGRDRPEKQFLMLDDFSFLVVDEALRNRADYCYLTAIKAIHSRDIYSGSMHTRNAACVNKLLAKLKEKEFYFMGAITNSEKIIVKDSLVDYKGELRQRAIDYKLGLETEGNKQSFDAYIVLDKLIEDIRIC